MDQQRFEELKEKRFSEGFTDEEADELGRMMAESEGKRCSSHVDLATIDEEPKAWDEVAKEGEESGQDVPDRG